MLKRYKLECLSHTSLFITVLSTANRQHNGSNHSLLLGKEDIGMLGGLFLKYLTYKNTPAYYSEANDKPKCCVTFTIEMLCCWMHQNYGCQSYKTFFSSLTLREKQGAVCHFQASLALSNACKKSPRPRHERDSRQSQNCSGRISKILRHRFSGFREKVPFSSV